jgi:hypothetical protein
VLAYIGSIKFYRLVKAKSALLSLIEGFALILRASSQRLPNI